MFYLNLFDCYDEVLPYFRNVRTIISSLVEMTLDGVCKISNIRSRTLQLITRSRNTHHHCSSLKMLGFCDVSWNGFKAVNLKFKNFVLGSKEDVGVRKHQHNSGHYPGLSLNSVTHIINGSLRIDPSKSTLQNTHCTKTVFSQHYFNLYTEIEKYEHRI